jgi:F-type H+-transporting ATPase subunit a
MKKTFRLPFTLFIAALLWAASPQISLAEEGSGHGATAAHAADSHGKDSHGGEHKTPGVFSPHGGTWLNPIVRAILGKPAPHLTEHNGEAHIGPEESVKYDFLAVALFMMAFLAIVATMGAKKMKLRPEGKPTSLANIVEAAAEGYQNYLVGIMGRDLASKYTPLIATFFFTILLLNYSGLIPGWTAPTANPNIPIGLAIVAFFATHIIAIKETGIKSWITHFVGEPVWLAPLNFPLHIIGEFIKPLSLAIRLLGNVFGEEMVVLKLAGLGIGLLAAYNLPFGLPFNLLMMLLGVLFGALQALVFSTLLAIYISILSTHHDDHDEHNIHGHVEHVRTPGPHGHDTIVAHPSETTVAMNAKTIEAAA